MHVSASTSAEVIAAPGNACYLVRAYPGAHFLRYAFPTRSAAVTYAEITSRQGYIAAAMTLDAEHAPSTPYASSTSSTSPTPSASLTPVSESRLAYSPTIETASAEDIIEAFGHVAYWRIRHRELSAALSAHLDAPTPDLKRINRLRLLMQDAMNNIEIYSN
jgi:hypothetical protein